MMLYYSYVWPCPTEHLILFGSLIQSSNFPNWLSLLILGLPLQLLPDVYILYNLGTSLYSFFEVTCNTCTFNCIKNKGVSACFLIKTNYRLLYNKLSA